MTEAEAWETLSEFPIDEPIVSMVIFKDRVLLATTKRVFYIKDGAVVPLVLKFDPEAWNDS